VWGLVFVVWFLGGVGGGLVSFLTGPFSYDSSWDLGRLLKGN